MRCFTVLLLLTTLLAQQIPALADGQCGADQDCGIDLSSVFGSPRSVMSALEVDAVEVDSLWDNLSIFAGLEGSKQPQDFGVNAHLGGRFAVNLGLPLCQHIGLGLQIGTSINYTDNAVQVFDRLGEASGRSQSFTTLGLFQRLDNGLVWAAAWDHLHQNFFDQTTLNQARGRIGWQFGFEEVGVRAQFSHDSDGALFLGTIPVVLEPISQGALYWAHTWENSARTTLWVGIAESHGERNIAFEALLDPPDPNQRPSGERVLFGAEIDIPLSDHWALFGQANFITPAYTGTVDSYLGVAFYPGGGARRARTNRYAPVQPVANSTSMSIDLR